MNIYDTKEKINSTFDPAFIPEEQLQTQWSELIQIKKAIYNLYHQKNRKIAILDIGVGTGRIINHLSGISEIWNCIESYHGIDNNEHCLSIAKQNLTDWKLGTNVSLSQLAARDINTLGRKFDIILTTWFTAGNFYPENFDFSQYDPSRKRLSLKHNPAFTSLWFTARKMLKKNGLVILGSCYHQNHSTRTKQENFYRQCKMTVITDAKDSFTATKEGFWSQRFKPRQVKKYLKHAGFKKIKLIDLDDYAFAFQVQMLS